MSKKSLAVVMLLCFLSFFGLSCASKYKAIVGKWKANDGSTMEFLDNGMAIVVDRSSITGNITLKWKIDKDILTIEPTGVTALMGTRVLRIEKLERNELTIKSLTNGNVETLVRVVDGASENTQPAANNQSPTNTESAPPPTDLKEKHQDAVNGMYSLLRALERYARDNNGNYPPLRKDCKNLKKYLGQYVDVKKALRSFAEGLESCGGSDQCFYLKGQSPIPVDNYVYTYIHGNTGKCGTGVATTTENH